MLKYASLLSVLWLAACSGSKRPKVLVTPGDTIASVRGVRAAAASASGGGSGVLQDGDRVRMGQRVRAPSGALWIDHDRGAHGLVESGGEVEVTRDGLRLLAGRLWVEATRGFRTVHETGALSVASRGGAFELGSVRGRHWVYAVRGRVTVRRAGQVVELEPGERAVVRNGKLVVEPVAFWSDWTGGLAFAARGASRMEGLLGELGARRPGDLGKARFPLRLRKLKVRAVVSGELALVRMEQHFFNPASERLEGLYRLRLPEGAVLQAFGVDRHGKVVFGFVKERERAREDYQAKVYRGSQENPALLEWVAPGQYQARLYPIEPGSTRRIVVMYSQWLDHHGSERRLRVPLAAAGAAGLRIGELDIQVGLDPSTARRVGCSMGCRVEKGRVVLRRMDFVPPSDFVVSLVPRKRANLFVQREETEEGRYFLARIPVLEGRQSSEPRKLKLVVLVDVSGATDRGHLLLARTLVDSLLQHLGPADRVLVAGADLKLRPLVEKGRFVPATEANRKAILDALGRVRPGGATDLGSVLMEAATRLGGGGGAVLYLGDAVPTVGELDLASLRRRMSRLPAPVRFYGVALGQRAHLDLLEGLAGGSGRALRVDSPTEAARAAMAILSHLSRPAAFKVTVDLGSGADRVFPRRPVDIVGSEPLEVLGRVQGKGPRMAVVRGTVDGRAFTRKVRLRAARIRDGGDLRLRWAAARLEQLLATGSGREELVDLGTRFALVTPYTSFYVPSHTEMDQSDVRERVGAAERRARRFEALLAKRFSKSKGAVAKALRKTTRAPSAPAEKEAAESKEKAADRAGAETTAAEEAAPSPAPPVRSRRKGAVGFGGGGGGAPLGAKAVKRRAVRGGGRKRVRRAAEMDRVVGGYGLGPRPKAAPSAPPVSSGTAPGMGVVARREWVLRAQRRRIAPGTSETKLRISRCLLCVWVPPHSPYACSAASRKSLRSRRALWRERLAWRGSVDGVLEVWHDALMHCELPDWESRRTLLVLMMRRLRSIRKKVRLALAFRRLRGTYRFLQILVLSQARTPQELGYVLARFGLSRATAAELEERILKRLRRPEDKVQAILTWLRVRPYDWRLRSRLLVLLEDLGRWKEAADMVSLVEGNPYADPDFRVDLAELLIRHGRQDEAKRLLSELVEFKPRDQALRRRLGDLYRAYGWFDDAYREYATLAGLRPSDTGVKLLMAMAAGGAGRVNEAIRLEREVAATASPSAATGVARWALLRLSLRLARLRAEARARGDGRRLAELMELTRRTGVLRWARPIRILLTWNHPYADTELLVGVSGYEPARPPLLGTLFGIEAFEDTHPDRETYRVVVRRPEGAKARRVTATLAVLFDEGKKTEKLWIRKLEFDPKKRAYEFVVRSGQVQEVQP